MVTGQVTRLGLSLRAAITLSIFGDDDRQIMVNATVDTGFTEFLTLPPRALHALGLPKENTVRVYLGDGSETQVNEYYAKIDWHGELIEVPIHESNGLPLIGMGLLIGNDLHIRAIHGGDVRIDPVS